MTSANLDLSSLRESVSKTFAELEEAKQRIEELQSHVRSEMDARLDALKISDVDPALLEDFLKEPYVIIPRRADEWYVIAPKWLNFSVGWLDRSTKSYNIFIVNRYVQWLSDIPALLRDKLKFERPLPVTVFDGIVLTGKEHQEAAAKVLGSLVLKRECADICPKKAITMSDKFELAGSDRSKMVNTYRKAPLCVSSDQFCVVKDKN